MLFYSIFAIALAASALATPPPGYVKIPDNDKDPPAYEYKYEIGDGTGKGQGKEETRAGEFASGSYYINTGDAATDVKYFVDDWGYHPVVKYGSTDKHSSTTTRFALGEHAVKALRNGGDVGPRVKLPSDSQKRKSVQIIQPYSVEDKDPDFSNPNYPTIADDTESHSGGFEELGEASRESSSVENSSKESRGPSTVLIPPVSHSTTPSALLESSSPLQEDAHISATPTTPTTLISYAPLHEVRDIYANNDYQNAALIDEQLFLQSAAGNFGQKVQLGSASTFDSGRSIIKEYKFPSTTTRPLTKQNEDVTYTVYSGSESNTAFLSSAGRTKKTQRIHDLYRKKIGPSSVTETPNYSVVYASTTLNPITETEDIIGNDLVSEKIHEHDYSHFGITDPHLVNLGLAAADQETIEINQQALEKKKSDSSNIGGTFRRPIVVAEVASSTGTYEESKHSASFECINDPVVPTTPATPIISTTFGSLIPSEEILITPKPQSQSHVTTSAVILNPIQVGVALVNAGEANLISDEASKSSEDQIAADILSVNSEAASVGSVLGGLQRVPLEDKIQQLQEQQHENELREENRIHAEKQLQQVQQQQLEQEIQLQAAYQLQRELELKGLQIEQHLQIENQLQENLKGQQQEERKYTYQQLGEETQLQQDVELQQVEESQQNEQLEHQQQVSEQIQAVGQLQVANADLVQKLIQQQQQEDIVLQQVQQSQIEEQLQQQQYEAEKIQEATESQLALQQQEQLQQQQYDLQQELNKYPEEHSKNLNSFLDSSGSRNDQGIEIQKSVEVYHNEPIQEIHYPAEVASNSESSHIESLQTDYSRAQQQQQFIKQLRNIENTQQAYRAIDQSGAHGSLAISSSHQPTLVHTDQVSSGAADSLQAQQVQVVNNQEDLNLAHDLIKSNFQHSQQTVNNNGVALLGLRANHEPSSSFRQDYQGDQYRGINQQANYQLSHSHLLSHSHQTHESNNKFRVQQVSSVNGLPYTLEASEELVVPGVSGTTTQLGDNQILQSVGRGVENQILIQRPHPVKNLIEKTVRIPQPYPVETIVEKKVPFPVEIEKIVEKQVPVHILRPFPVEVEKVIEKKVPYPVDRVVEKHIPILQPYPVHIKVPQPYPVEKVVEKQVPYAIETIVEKPIKIHVPVATIVEKKVPVPYPVEKIVEKTVHVPKPYPIEKIVERVVEKPVHVRVPYPVEVVRNVPYGVHYGVTYQQIMRPHGHSLYLNHGKPRIPFYGLPVSARHQEFRHQDNGHQFQAYGYEKPGISFSENGVSDQSIANSQLIAYKHSVHPNSGKKFNSHIIYPHHSLRRHTARIAGKEQQSSDEYIGPVPPQRSPPIVRHRQHSLQQNQHVPQLARAPQSQTSATRSPTSTTTLRRVKEPETKPQSNPGNFRQSRVEYGFKPPMIPSVQYDEKTASKVES